MNPFEWHFPTKLVYGPGRLDELGINAKNYGQKAMIVSYARGNGLDNTLESMQSSLQAAAIDYVVFAAIEPNPRSNTIDKATALFISQECDFVIALGGGSVIDAGKYIAATAFSGGSCWDYIMQAGKAPKRFLGAYPLIAIPSIATVGSEVNSTAVVVNSRTHEKGITQTDVFYPTMALVDPQIHTSVPLRLTQDSCISIFSSLLASYLVSTDESEFADRLTESMILCLKDSTEQIIYDIDNDAVRGQLALCAIFAGSGAQAQDKLTRMPLQCLEMPLSARYDLPCGRGMVVLIVAYLAFFADAMPARWAKLARRCFAVTEPDDLKAAAMLSHEVAKWFKSTHSYLTLGDVGIPDEKFDLMAEDAMRLFANAGELAALGKRCVTKQDVIDIYNLCK
ncbi:iron-containing alcohol dehydrogenase [Pseudoalteromonas shioyasakiensis]|uniref:iron-containing alcohol dehydrogenase n=1 Tax=Pseudoalteromonas shioyasakiensis TaxID=1190813 RepID=UPI0021192A96|nr:iron-containing alcohol dehydrogenase [Pseudoalteromonas shioyasakiensis]MCQ8878588.1 iron-containing alcohol dehydrogenase [Pseudoalteromonas shioyasakiensis]